MSGKRLKKSQPRLLVKIIGLSIILFAVLNLTLRFSSLSSLIQKPLNKDENSTQTFLTPNFNYRVNFLLMESENGQIRQATLASFEAKDENRLDLIQITFEASKEIQEAQSKEELVKEVKKVFGLPIDGFINFTEFTGRLDENEVKNFKNSLSLANILKIVDFYLYVNKNVKTSLSFKDLISVLFKLQNIREDKIREHSTEELLVGNSLEKSLIDDFAQKNLSEPSVLSEGAKIEVRNATGVSGLAYQVSRLVSNAGGNVINIANSESLSEETVIYAYFDRPKTVEYLARVLKAKVVREKDEDARADLVVAIGKDFVDQNESQ